MSGDIHYDGTQISIYICPNHPNEVWNATSFPPVCLPCHLKELRRYLREAVELLERDAPIGGATFNACKKFRTYLEGR